MTPHPLADATVRARRRAPALPALASLLLLALIACTDSSTVAPVTVVVAASAAAAARPLPEVRTARAQAVKLGAALRLPARTEPIEEARIYARTSGTLTERRVDLGDRVAAGAVLARIAAPEVDQALAIALANRRQALARERMAQLTLDRNRPLVEQNFLSSSRLDDLAGALEVARADTAAASAEVRRYEALQNFQTVRAPFAGTIVERSVERGDRISADGANNTPALFRLARLGELRVVVDVPQSAVAGVKPGQSARVSFQEFPGEAFEARVERLSGRIDTGSSSMRVELKLANAELRVPAGLRGEVALGQTVAASDVAVPATALKLVDGRPHVATLDAENRLRFVPVQVRRTLGQNVEVSQGLAAGTLVVVNVNSLLQEGQAVRAAAPVSAHAAVPVPAPVSASVSAPAAPADRAP